MDDVWTEVKRVREEGGRGGKRRRRNISKRMQRKREE